MALGRTHPVLPQQFGTSSPPGFPPHYFYHSLFVEKFLQFIRVVTRRVNSISCLLNSGFRTDEDWSVNALSLDFEDSHRVRRPLRNFARARIEIPAQ